MLYYELSFPRPHQQIIEIALTYWADAGVAHFRLPHWRPGRYELQNYARLVADVRATDEEGAPLICKKFQSHGWAVEVPAATQLRLRYRFFANQTDAGGTYLDARHLLFNGITCLMYPAQALEQPCQMKLHLPEAFKLSGGLNEKEGAYHFSDFHTLVDSPFLAGPDLQHEALTLAAFPIHLWVLGDAHPDFERWKRDIEQYSRAQLEFWGSCPVEEYHYLYFMLPHRYRHGVEHHQSTVIVMGPGRNINQPEAYQSLLEISSHEFFHTWNVKALRPADMWPYRYEEENYSALHYVTEGITTYYGDLMLWKAGIWGLDEWIKSINGELGRHYQTGAQEFISLTEASFDSWVNGYRIDGFPNRRISFYTKGYLVSMLLDTEIRRLTDHRASLDTVITELYYRVTGENRGYTRADYLSVIEGQTGHSFEAFFAQYIDGTQDLKPALQQLGQIYGLMMVDLEPVSPSLARYGLRTSTHEQGQVSVEQMYPGSPAEASGLMLGAELLAIEGYAVQGKLDELLHYLGERAVLRVQFRHMGRSQEVLLEASDYRYTSPQFVVMGQPTPEQRQALACWQAVVPAVGAPAPQTPSH